MTELLITYQIQHNVVAIMTSYFLGD